MPVPAHVLEIPGRQATSLFLPSEDDSNDNDNDDNETMTMGLKVIISPQGQRSKL